MSLPAAPREPTATAAPTPAATATPAPRPTDGAGQLAGFLGRIHTIEGTRLGIRELDVLTR